MAAQRNKHLRIYSSKRHLLFPLAVAILPFLFLLFFSEFTHIAKGALAYDMFVSSLRLSIAYVISVIIAWILAALFYRGRRAAIALPIFDLLQSFPTFAALPLAVLFLGASNYTVIFFLVLTVIWPILFSLISSLKLIRRDWEEVAEISGLHGWSYLKSFLLPISFPGLITGSVIGLGEGWEALVATEIIVGKTSGLGSFFERFSTDTTVTALGILGLLIVIFSINKLIWMPLLEIGHQEMGE
jgi:ABC-type nitrate/sulfonate/bicarbonate transport system permease component